MEGSTIERTPCRHCGEEKELQDGICLQDGYYICPECTVALYNQLSRFVAQYTTEDNRAYTNISLELRKDTKESLINGIEAACKMATDREGDNYEATVVNTLKYLTAEHKRKIPEEGERRFI